MSDTWTVVTNLILPTLLAVVLGLAWSGWATLVVTAIYLLGGAVTVLWVERKGGEHSLIVFTGWYSFLLGLEG